MDIKFEKKCVIVNGARLSYLTGLREVVAHVKTLEKELYYSTQMENDMREKIHTEIRRNEEVSEWNAELTEAILKIIDKHPHVVDLRKVLEFSLKNGGFRPSDLAINEGKEQETDIAAIVAEMERQSFFGREKIPAIKWLQDRTGWGSRESKDFVDKYWSKI